MTSTIPSPTDVSAPARGEWKELLGRVGLAAKGVLYGVVGILALQLATGGASEEASLGGAIEWIGSQPLGRFLLVALTASLFALAAWRALDAWVGDPVEGDGVKERVKFAVEAVVYGSLGVVALTTTVSNWSSGGSEGGVDGGASTEQQAAATVLDWPAGRWLVIAAGLAAVAGAVYVVTTHVVHEQFLERLDVGDRRWVEVAGRIGYAARAATAALVGWFLVRAGAQYDPEEAKGLSAALQELSGQGWGQLALWLVAIGLVGAGLFSMAEAKLRRAA